MPYEKKQITKINPVELLSILNEERQRDDISTITKCNLSFLSGFLYSITASPSDKKKRLIQAHNIGKQIALKHAKVPTDTKN